jgi:hypothetical protein
MTGASHVMFAMLVVSCSAYRLVGFYRELMVSYILPAQDVEQEDRDTKSVYLRYWKVSCTHDPALCSSECKLDWTDNLPK